MTLSDAQVIERLQEIARALNPEIGADFKIYLRKKCNLSPFYCDFDYVEIEGDGVLIGAYGNGNTPQEAMRDYLEKITGKTIVFHATRDDRKELTVM